MFTNIKTQVVAAFTAVKDSKFTYLAVGIVVGLVVAHII